MIRRLIAALILIAPPGVAAADANQAVFSYLSYDGHDPAMTGPVAADRYLNPIIPGFHPDPSVVRVADAYYLVNSTFAFYPGLPIYRSADLINWTQIGNAIDRPGMFDFTGLGIQRAVFAPTIRYHAGLFYIVNTCIECGFNFIITAKDPAGPWSDPVFLGAIDGIDPDLFFDDDGRVWIANNGPPIGTPEYDGHRAIWIQEFDVKAKRMIGARTVIVNGGVKFADKPIWTEGPHIFKRDGWYYLIAAEGGTAGNHSETVFRSRAVTGPYTPGPVNPILTQRDLDPARANPIYATGHADFVQTQSGKWWAVFLGTRPYDANLSNMGRETFMLPVTWPKGGWPVILPPKTAVPRVVERPKLPRSLAPDRDHWHDDFTDATLAHSWIMLRTPRQKWYSLAAHPGSLTLTPGLATLGSKANPSFLAQRQRHPDATVETKMHYRPEALGDIAGLAIFADEYHYYVLGLMQTAAGPTVTVLRRDGKDQAEAGVVIASVPFAAAPGTPLRLRIETKGKDLVMAFAIDAGDFQTLVSGSGGRILASESTNQFTGTVIGVMAHAAH